jgi:MerR family transcriptional regulator, thiopeptide resistance regulator
MFSNEKLWQTKEFAELAKVTVRTLHYYDRINLLKPKYFDRNGFRLYGEPEFARLQQITTLKFIGFSLAQIKEILEEREFNLSETLQLQRKIIESQRNRLNLALEAISRAEKQFQSDGTTDWESFTKIIEVINMEQNTEWTKRYYSESAQKKIEELKNRWSPELQERVDKDWKELFLEVKSAIADGVKPSDEKAQILASRWNALLNEFTGGDAEVREGLNKMYADEKNWQTDWKKPFSDEVQNFIFEAMNIKK